MADHFILSAKGTNKTEKDTTNDPVGLDIGTTNIVSACGRNGDAKTVNELNAFFTVPALPITINILTQKKILFFEKNKKLYVMGNSAEEFATILGGEPKKPMVGGIVNLKEYEGINVIKTILENLIEKTNQKGARIVFSVPGPPVDGWDNVIFNEFIFKDYLRSLGYSPEPINEGMAVILSELSGNSATGIGISMGGGMCNVCLSYLSISVVAYSIQKGGDYIDSMVAASVGEPITKVRNIKESELNLAIEPKNSIEIGLHIYYDILFSTLIKSLQKILWSSENVPRISEAIPMILSGGTIMPPGSKAKFEKALKENSLPVRISDITLAQKPLCATAKGALVVAESGQNDYSS